MEDENIKQLFSAFNPSIGSSDQFMTRLLRNMEIVEMVKQNNLALKRRNRLAVLIAALCGFVVGVLLTLLFPLVGDWVSSFSISLPHLTIASLTIDYRFVGWIVMAGVSCITALNAYEVAMSKMTPSTVR